MNGYIEQKIIELQNSKTATEITQNAKYFINILAENERLTEQEKAKMEKRKMTLEEVNKYLLSEINVYKILSEEMSSVCGCENTCSEYKRSAELLQEVYDTINYEM